MRLPPRYIPPPRWITSLPADVVEELGNPYWDELTRKISDRQLKLHADTDAVYGDGWTGRGELKRLERRYSPTIPDPDLVDWVTAVVGPRSVEIDCGPAYWSRLMHDRGVHTVAYDLSPPIVQYHWVDLLMRARTELGIHASYTLMCMSAEFPFRSFALALPRFAGTRFVLSASRLPGESELLREILDEFGWHEKDRRRGRHASASPRTVYYYERTEVSWKMAPTQHMAVVVRT